MLYRLLILFLKYILLRAILINIVDNSMLQHLDNKDLHNRIDSDPLHGCKHHFPSLHCLIQCQLWQYLFIEYQSSRFNFAKVSEKINSKKYLIKSFC
jgi:hypothetical protein